MFCEVANHDHNFRSVCIVGSSVTTRAWSLWDSNEARVEESQKQPLIATKRPIAWDAQANCKVEGRTFARTTLEDQAREYRESQAKCEEEHHGHDQDEDRSRPRPQVHKREKAAGHPHARTVKGEVQNHEADRRRRSLQRMHLKARGKLRHSAEEAVQGNADSESELGA